MAVGLFTKGYFLRMSVQQLQTSDPSTAGLQERIQLARRAAGLGKQQLATLIGVTRSAIDLWESGKSKDLSASNLLKCVRVLRVNPEWLLWGLGPRERECGNLAEHIAQFATVLAASTPAEIEGIVTLLSSRHQLPIRPPQKPVAVKHRRSGGIGNSKAEPASSRRTPASA